MSADDVASSACPLLDVALGVLRSHPYGFLGTTSSGGPAQRLVQHLAVDDDATVWIGTSPRSRKVSDLRRRPRAAYAVEDRASVAYACAVGEVAIIDSAVERERRWEEGLRAFFPTGPGGDDFVLLRLRPEAIEVISFGAGVHPEPYGLVPAVVERVGDAWMLRT